METNEVECEELLRYATRHNTFGTLAYLTGAQLLRLLRDIDRLLAALAEARAENERVRTLNRDLHDQLKQVRVEARADAKKAREEERADLQRDIQAMREQYAPLEEGEAVMLDTLQDRVERRSRKERAKMADFHGAERRRIAGRPAWLSRPGVVLPEVSIAPASRDGEVLSLSILVPSDSGAFIVQSLSLRLTLAAFESFWRDWVAGPEAAVEKWLGVRVLPVSSRSPGDSVGQSDASEADLGL